MRLCCNSVTKGKLLVFVNLLAFLWNPMHKCRHCGIHHVYCIEGQVFPETIYKAFFKSQFYHSIKQFGVLSQEFIVWWDYESRPCFNMKGFHPGMEISIIKISLSLDHLIFIMAISILSRHNFCNELPAWLLVLWCRHNQVYIKSCYVISHACHNFNGLIGLPLEFGPGLVITSHENHGM